MQVHYIQIQGLVLIVAKCNVNKKEVMAKNDISEVLIVAKCNVNVLVADISIPATLVLIVAKCNVN